MNVVLDIFFPIRPSKAVHWYRYVQTPYSELEHGNWFTAHEAREALQQWCQTHIIHLYIPGEWISIWQTELPVVATRQIPHVLPALLEEDLHQDIDELHFSALYVEGKKATVAVIHQSHMRDILDWLQECGLTRVTVAPDWMSVPEGHMVIDSDRCLTRIDICRGWSTGMALAPEMFRAHASEHPGPLHMAVVGDKKESVADWIDSCAEQATFVHCGALSERGQPEGNLLAGKCQPRISYQQQWMRWRPFVFPVLLTLFCLTLERGIALWSISERMTQSRSSVEQQFLNLFPDQQRIVNLRSQVNMSLGKYRSHSNANELTALLPLIAKTIKSTSLKDIQMRGLTFDRQRQTIQLQLRARDFASFDTLRAAFATHFRVQQDALQKENEYVSGAVILERKQDVTR